MSASVPDQLERFARHGNDVVGVLQRVGAGTYDLVLIDAEGNWERAVVAAEATARDFCEATQTPLHDGWEDPALAQRANSLDAWATEGAKRRAI
jgi:hypothetical protein